MGQFGTLKKFLTDEDLIEKATIDFTGADTNKERLRRTLNMLLDLIPVAEGLYRSKPTQSTCYALSNLIGQTNEVMAQYEASIDYDQLADDIYEKLVIPAIEELVKDTGMHVKLSKKEIGKLLPSKKKKTSKILKDMYRQFGVSCEEKMKQINEQLPKFIVSNL